MWAEANNYYYRGRKVAQTKGGSLYTAPEIKILEDPEPNGEPLRFVDIPGMIEKNKGIIESLTQETIKKVYNTYIDYKDKVDVFHVSYSGGKDSEVTFDIVKRALPHNAFIVIFGDTGMEFPDTYKAVDITKLFCDKEGINFYVAHSDFKPLDSWKLFGPPSSAMRWCCGVHKTAPQLLKLREITGKQDVKEMAFVGVRSSESVRRSGYDYISFGTKHKGQLSFNPILDWNSAEVYIYIYMQNLLMNDAYKKGSSRVGCLFCPMAALKSDFFNYTLYKDELQPYIDIIKNLYVDGRGDEKLINSYVENKGWKARKNGRDLIIGVGDFTEETKADRRKVKVKRHNDMWKEWMKTLGYLDYDGNNYSLAINDTTTIHFSVTSLDNEYIEFTFYEYEVKKSATVFKNIKNLLKKSHSCVSCRYCEANCPNGNIHFSNGKVTISDNCIKCGLCNNIDNGCLIYNSLILPKGTGKMKKGSIDEYGTHPPKLAWIKEFIKYRDTFESNHTLGSAMLPMFRKFLRDAGITNKNNTWNTLTNILFKSELETEYTWALMLANLAYAPQVGWLVTNLDFYTTYSQNELKDILSNYITSKTGPGNIANSYKRISELPFKNVGFGTVTGKDKNGFIFIRTPWKNPDPRVILYSLFKFAEACGDYYQFTLSRLLNHDIDSEGVSPTEIFGLEKDQMEKILNGLSINYPDFINASFTLDLDNITLRGDKSSQDVLNLF
ncbi:phosphoadenosine phosphosulfate reductase domain-containing protein [Anaerovorax sp. IOR16]|uniref:phosphoadenosine phosphosulfate reductase domain-containing protein n=1 Tax=Anaerovorax sp. IOR16 TaxID=2773458 RepID=UPI001FD7008B|nr:phosphoadenosine phosphosulfate reductase family protein [Anaerovorax sp. IOR16]